jgi:Family of unknown function (DUF5681)
MTKSDHDDKEYRVGYRKPPREHQFKKGEPQEFRRRAKRIATPRETLARLANQQVTISERGKTRKVSTVEAIFLRLQSQALGGDAKAIAIWMTVVWKAIESLTVADARSEQEAIDAKKRLIEKIEDMARRHLAAQDEKINQEG